jgi:two-component system chemotaxis sensor kinase CheA
MSKLTEANIAEITALLQGLATEFAFLEAGSATGTDALHASLEAIKTAAGPHAAPGFLQELEAGAGIVNSAAAAGAFSDEMLKGLNAWYPRLETALHQWIHSPEQAAPTPAAATGTPAGAGDSTDSNGATDSETSEAEVVEEPVLVIEIGDDGDLLNEFCNEGRDLLQDIEQGVLVLEENPSHKDTLNRVFRAFHTFKGGAGYLGLEAIKNLAHELESVLDAARRGELPITTPVIDIILAGGDALRQFIEKISERLAGTNAGEPICIPTLSIIARSHACLHGEPEPEAAAPAPTAPQPKAAAKPEAAPSVQPPPAPQQTPAVSHNPSAPPPAPAPPEPAPATAQPEAQQVAAPPAPPAPQHSAPAPALATAQPAVSNAPKPAKPKAANPASGEGPANFVKIDTLKLDSLVDLVGELVIAQSMVIQHPEVMELSDRQLARCMRQLARITTDLQHNAMSLRMVPIRAAFQKMTRLVRDLAGSQGKQIQLILSGEDTELDRNIVEELADPLIHMIRNSADHGIEMPDERVAKGKPALGTIRLQAYHQGGGIVICIADDGKGLDKDRIVAKAIQKGIIEPHASLSEKEIFELIFAPGFSTAEKVTDLSGRGVGMDVVRGNISRLRGRIEVESTFGKGSSFTIFLPLTLAIIDGLLVSLGDERFILPTLSVRECLRITENMISTVQGTGELVSVRGKLMPLVRLGNLLGIPGATNDATKGIIVVAESGTTQRCLLVDELLGKKEVVIKSLGDAFKSQVLMSGAAILGDGRVALIVDLDALANLKSLPRAAVA